MMLHRFLARQIIGQRLKPGLVVLAVRQRCGIRPRIGLMYRKAFAAL
jgi:hypothetical protein